MTCWFYSFLLVDIHYLCTFSLLWLKPLIDVLKCCINKTKYSSYICKNTALCLLAKCTFLLGFIYSLSTAGFIYHYCIRAIVNRSDICQWLAAIPWAVNIVFIRTDAGFSRYALTVCAPPATQLKLHLIFDKTMSLKSIKTIVNKRPKIITPTQLGLTDVCAEVLCLVPTTVHYGRTSLLWFHLSWWLCSRHLLPIFTFWFQ